MVEPGRSGERRGWSRGSSRLGFELVVVFLGVLGAFMVEGYREGRERSVLARQIYGGLHAEIRATQAYTGHVVELLERDLAAFDSAYAAGLRPVPVYFRIEGSEMPPSGAFQAAMSAQTTGLLEPELLFEVSSFYNEMTGVSHRFVRYATFTESRVLPYLADHRAAFYEPDSDRLKPEYVAHIDRLREFHEWWDYYAKWADKLLAQLAEAAGGAVEGRSPELRPAGRPR